MRKTNNQLLLDAGRSYVWNFHKGGPGVRSLLTGKSHPFLESMCLRHAKYQAKHETQGHQLWGRGPDFDPPGDRKDEILANLPEGFTCEENAAESWPDNTRVEAATEMFHSWEQSPGHWSMCNHRCVYFGINMSKGKNGVWYAAMLVAWK